MGKPIILLAALTLILSISSCSKSPEQLLLGEWLATDLSGGTASFVFNKDGSVIVIEGSTVFDGSWKLNASQNPMHLDLVMSETSGEVMTILGIVRFLGEMKMQIRISEDDKLRPTNFLQSVSVDPNQMILVKQ